MSWLKFKLYINEIHPNKLIDSKIKKLIEIHTRFSKNYFKQYKSRRSGWEFHTITFLAKYNNNLEKELMNNGVPAKFLYEFRQIRQYHLTILEQYVKMISKSNIYTSSTDKDSIFLNLINSIEEVIVINWEATLRNFTENELMEMFE